MGRDHGLDAVIDVSDADSHPPAGAVSDLTYSTDPLVDADDLPVPAVTLPLAETVAGLIAERRAGERGLRALHVRP